MCTFRFPYPYEEPSRYQQLVSSFYKFVLPEDDTVVVGWMLQDIVRKLPLIPELGLKVDHTKRTVQPTGKEDDGPSSASKILEDFLLHVRHTGSIAVLKGWRNELYPVLGSAYGLKIERAASALFGIVTLGVHMTAYTMTSNGMSIWVPRRAKTKQTFASMLDNSVAGGISADETPFESLVREAAEEASLPEELVRNKAVACGTVSYLHVRDHRAGGEEGLIQPEIEYVYDLELPSSVVPKPCDFEVQEFYLWSTAEVLQAVKEGQFKPNCALVLVDFFVRHGILTAENEPDYVSISQRMHRMLPFPMTPVSSSREDK
ncbi:hypothetical protein MMC25_005894 [Agyrium rufum]|nr:hypothetical protein [Agyrium rufum]